MINVVGLGNPGAKYANNRHNVGSMFVDYIVNEFASSRVREFKPNKYLQSQLTKLVIDNRQILLVKPQTYMNRSGAAVKKLTNHYSLTTNHLMVVHDDLDIPLGKFKIQKGVGPKLHNGIESIEQTLGTKDFWRVRIGVDNRTSTSRVDGETYVLQDFLSEEKQLLLSSAFKRVWTNLELRIKKYLL